MERVGLRRRDPRPVLYPLARAISRPAASSTRSPPTSISLPTLLASCGVAPPRDRETSTARVSCLCSAASRPPAGPSGRCSSSGTAAIGPSSAAAFAARSQTYKLVRREPLPGAARRRRSSSTTWSTTRSSSTTSPRVTPISWPGCMRNTSLVQGRNLHPRLRSGPDRARRHSREPHDPDPPRLARTARWVGPQ